MIVKNEVELHQESVKYIKEVLGMYTEIDRLDDTKHFKNPIIHIYPMQDTYDVNGELRGYIDAIFFNLHLYDTENKTVWKSKRPHDAIIPFMRNATFSQIKIFKDLSTLIALDGVYRVNGSFQAFEVEKIQYSIYAERRKKE